MRRLIFICAFCISLWGMQLQAQTASAKVGFAVQLELQSDACSGQSAIVKASGGQAPYSYHWNDGSREASRTQLSEGTYSCTVTDANGQKLTKQLVVTRVHNPIKISLNISDGQQRTARVAVSGGKAPYSYYWFGKGIDAQDSPQLRLPDNLEGDLILVVRDANGCAVQYAQQFTKQN